MNLLSRTTRRCYYGHRHRDGQTLCRTWFIHEDAAVRKHHARSLRRTNRVRLQKGLEPQRPPRTQGWETH